MNQSKPLTLTPEPTMGSFIYQSNTTAIWMNQSKPLTSWRQSLRWVQYHRQRDPSNPSSVLEILDLDDATSGRRVLWCLERITWNDRLSIRRKPCASVLYTLDGPRCVATEAGPTPKPACFFLSTGPSVPRTGSHSTSQMDPTLCNRGGIRKWVITMFWSSTWIPLFFSSRCTWVGTWVWCWPYMIYVVL